MRRLCLLLLLISCSRRCPEVKVAATSVPQAEILQEANRMLIEQQKCPVKIVEVDDYAIPNRLLAEKQVDANYFQHKPFLDLQKEQFGYKFEVLTTVHIEPMGIYSTQISSLEELPDCAKVAVPNDPTNEKRALLLLQEQGLIQLNDTAYPTSCDIVENPKNLQIEELDAPLLPRMLSDAIIAVIPANFALMAHIDPHSALISERGDSPYANIVVVREGESRIEITNLSKVLNSKEMSKYIRVKYKGAVLPTH
ncbi:MAG: D-methionine-binding lipoprotein MetQ [Chlamydiales bacterium]|nr:D-methionine-binding lipoprotein MetQ [Chlamydiales bacterium]MCH9636113.1 D-methionine-binding lipoprotein MetQ [Chlamydiales bacterium]MCH9704174.1 methionine ABC transporter substrate-binding protein [Chlamydiota bacterium]